jgi:hypothetical protein
MRAGGERKKEVLRLALSLYQSNYRCCKLQAYNVWGGVQPVKGDPGEFDEVILSQDDFLSRHRS